MQHLHVICFIKNLISGKAFCFSAGDNAGILNLLCAEGNIVERIFFLFVVRIRIFFIFTD
jgi:hypothetical protein